METFALMGGFAKTWRLTTAGFAEEQTRHVTPWFSKISSEVQILGLLWIINIISTRNF